MSSDDPAWLDSGLILLGLWIWADSSARGDSLGVNIGFMCVAIPIGQWMGWV